MVEPAPEQPPEAQEPESEPEPEPELVPEPDELELEPEPQMRRRMVRGDLDGGQGTLPPPPARSAAAAGVPSEGASGPGGWSGTSNGWQRKVDPGSGRRLYLQRRTGKVLFETPPNRRLPAGWLSAVSAETARVFYNQPSSGRSQYTLPPQPSASESFDCLAAPTRSLRTHTRTHTPNPRPEQLHTDRRAGR